MMMKRFWILFLYLINLSHIYGQENNSIKNTEWCLTEDNVPMATDVYLPKGEGPFSTILIRTPYNKDYYVGYGNEFSLKGFAVVIQDVRGKWSSKGEFYPFINETMDGLSVLDFIQSQTWSNGKVGMFGESYPGFCGLTLSASQHPALTTIFQMSGWAEPSKMAQPGGAGQIMLNIPWLLNEYMQNTGHIVDFEMEELFEFLPQKDVFKSLGVSMNAWEEPDKMQQYNTDFDYSKVDIPIFHAAGWYDFVGEGTISTYLGIDKSKAETQHLIIGPWFHNQMETTLTDLNEVEFGENAVYGRNKIMELAISWFDHWLNDAKNAHWSTHSAKYYVLFENEWRTCETWPPENIETRKFYLHSNGNANTRHGDGKLVNSPFEGKGDDQYIFDPNYPVPTNGGANFHFFPEQMGIKDQRELEERQDILIYTSEPFEEKSIVAGNVKFELYAASDASDTDFTAKLVLVDAEGNAWNIVDGIIRARYRNGFPIEELVKPGNIYKYNINLGNTSFRINPGERLRLEISSSNFPKYDRSSNSEVHPFEASILHKANQKVIHGKDYPSAIYIPFINENY